MRVKRVLIYTGEKDWLEGTLKSSALQKDNPLNIFTHGSILLESEEVIEE